MAYLKKFSVDEEFYSFQTEDNFEIQSS